MQDFPALCAAWLLLAVALGAFLLTNPPGSHVIHAPAGAVAER